MDSKQVEAFFYVMKDSTVCLAEATKDNIFNSMCDTLHCKLDVEKKVLADFLWKNLAIFTWFRVMNAVKKLNGTVHAKPV